MVHAKMRVLTSSSAISELDASWICMAQPSSCGIEVSSCWV